MPAQSKINQAVGARLEYDKVNSDIRAGKYQTILTDEGVNEYMNMIATTWLNAEDALTIPEYHQYMQQYERQKRQSPDLPTTEGVTHD